MYIYITKQICSELKSKCNISSLFLSYSYLLYYCIEHCVYT